MFDCSKGRRCCCSRKSTAPGFVLFHLHGTHQRNGSQWKNAFRWWVPNVASPTTKSRTASRSSLIRKELLNLECFSTVGCLLYTYCYFAESRKTVCSEVFQFGTATHIGNTPMNEIYVSGVTYSKLAHNIEATLTDSLQVSKSSACSSRRDALDQIRSTTNVSTYSGSIDIASGFVGLLNLSTRVLLLESKYI